MLENKDELDNFLWKELDEKVYLAYDCDNTYDMLVSITVNCKYFKMKKSQLLSLDSLDNTVNNRL